MNQSDVLIGTKPFMHTDATGASSDTIFARLGCDADNSNFACRRLRFRLRGQGCSTNLTIRIIQPAYLPLPPRRQDIPPLRAQCDW